MFEGTKHCIVLSLIYVFAHLPLSFTLILNTRMAQLVEHWAVMREVVSLIPAGPILRVLK